MLLKQSVITKIAVQERREILEITLCKCFSHYHVVCTLLCIQSRYKTSDLNLLDKNKSFLNTYFFFFCHFIIGEIFIWPTNCLIFAIFVIIFLLALLRLVSHRGKHIKKFLALWERRRGLRIDWSCIKSFSNSLSFKGQLYNQKYTI